MGKCTYRGFRKAGDPVLGVTTIVIGRPWRTTAEDLARKKAKASDEKKTENSPKKEQ